MGVEPSRGGLAAHAPDPLSIGVRPVLGRLQGLKLMSRQWLRRRPTESQRETLRGG